MAMSMAEAQQRKAEGTGTQPGVRRHVVGQPLGELAQNAKPGDGKGIAAERLLRKLQKDKARGSEG